MFGCTLAYYNPDSFAHPNIYASDGSQDDRTQTSSNDNQDDLYFVRALPSAPPHCSLSISLMSGQILTVQSGRNAQKTFHHSFPPIPAPVFYSALTQPAQFAAYIALQFPLFQPSSALSIPGKSLSSASAPSALGATPDISQETSSEVTELLRQPPGVAKYIDSVALNPSKDIKTVQGLDWINEGVFPNHLLPVPYDSNLIRNSADLWNKNQKFICMLPEMKEPALAHWLNQLSTAIGRLHRVVESPSQPDEENRQDEEVAVNSDRASRSFDSRSHSRGPSGASLYRKPDVTLVDKSILDALSNDRLRWFYIHALVEISPKQSKTVLIKTLLEKAAATFETQPNRRWLCCLGFLGTPAALKYFFMYVDRSGPTCSQTFDFDSYAALALGRILFALSFAPASSIGVDPTMTVDPSTLLVTHVRITDTTSSGPRAGSTETFRLIREIHRPSRLFSRATRVFVAQSTSSNRFYIYKDSWILASHQTSEIDQLLHIQQTLLSDPENVDRFRNICPQLYMAQELDEDMTSHRRGALINIPPVRVHRRIIMGPVGDPITSFRSRGEFIKAMIDVVDCTFHVLLIIGNLLTLVPVLEFLNDKCGVVHGDISINNIVINRVSSSGANDALSGDVLPYGSPIDYDYSRKKDTVSRHASVS